MTELQETVLLEQTADTPEALAGIGRQLAASLRAGDLLVLTGPLGAGKTTFTRGLAEGLNVRGTVSSPTFVIARTHPSLVGGPDLIHVDAYRLPGPAELDDLGLDYQASVTVVEWGDGYLDGVAESRLEVLIERPLGLGGDLEPMLEEQADPDETIVEPRQVRIVGWGPRWAEQS